MYSINNPTVEKILVYAKCILIYFNKKFLFMSKEK